MKKQPRILTALLLLMAAGLAGCGGEEPPLPASQGAALLDEQVDWSRAKLIAVQDGGRYKTLDSFAREAFATMSGREHLPGLSPTASLFEWLFNRSAYADERLVKIREAAVRLELAQSLPPDVRTMLVDQRFFTLREITDPRVQQQLQRMATQNIMRTAVNRVFGALAMADRMQQFFAIVPEPGGDEEAPWYPVDAVAVNLNDEALSQLGVGFATPPDESEKIPNLTSDQALRLTVDWQLLRRAWLSGDAGNVQTYVDRLAGYLPTLAAADVYPALSQRQAEATYYQQHKFIYAYLVYFFALLISVVALVTSWKTPRVLTYLLLLIGLGLHAYGLGLRWYILGRIPVANMFEAVNAAAWMGIATAIAVELFVRSRVLLVGAAATGFCGLVIAGFAVPGAELSTIPGILDDIQLRLHTVLIIASYALIFVAAVVAVIYLLGYYGVRLKQRLASEPQPAAAGDDDGISLTRPVLAGALPGDEGTRANLPAWLNNIDWSHLIILNMVFILLFVGTILGAWWADYSWGRPWGWDPKEVFALNTWIVYAILLHVRYVVRNRGLWTAWLSLLGCGFMAFNWFFVNFYISSVHSYA